MRAPGRCCAIVAKVPSRSRSLAMSETRILQSQRLTAGLNVAQQRTGRRVLGISEHRDRFGCGHQGVQKLQPLAAEHRGQIGHTGGIAARAV